MVYTQYKVVFSSAAIPKITFPYFGTSAVDSDGIISARKYAPFARNLFWGSPQIPGVHPA
jgi:hypothetical protein